MKGITPIISIIILLLLTVGLAATAWTYMSNYLTGLTAKSIEISTQKCITGASGQDTMLVVHNMGTATMNVGAGGDIVIWDQRGDAVPYGTLSWEEIQSSTSITEILAGRYGKLKIDCCGGDIALYPTTERQGQVSCPLTCTFDLVISGRTQTTTVYCP